MIAPWVFQLGTGLALLAVGGMARWLSGQSKELRRVEKELNTRIQDMELAQLREFPNKADFEKFWHRLDELSSRIQEVHTMVVRLDSSKSKE